MALVEYKLVIIGAGPGGISMATEAIKSGISPKDVVVLEKSMAHSFSIRKFYPDNKLVSANYKGHAAVCKGVLCLQDSSKAETISYLDKAIADHTIDVRYNETVWKIDRPQSGGFVVFTGSESYPCEVCVIAIGMMGKPNKPDYPIPAEVRCRVHYDITSTPIANRRVLVVGGGDSASEYVQFLAQEGNRVTLSYRRDGFDRMNAINNQALMALKERGEIDILLNSNVQQLAAEGDMIAAHFAEADYPRLLCDHVVLALGGSAPKNFLKLLGIEFDGQGPVIKEGFETSIPGLFLIGDLSAGKRGGSIITAFNSAHEAMRKICDNHLACEVH